MSGLCIDDDKLDQAIVHAKLHFGDGGVEAIIEMGDFLLWWFVNV